MDSHLSSSPFDSTCCRLRVLSGIMAPDLQASRDAVMLYILPFPIVARIARCHERSLEDLASYGPTPYRSDRTGEQATQDLVNVAARAAFATILTIPILVIVWGNFRSRICQSVEFTLATLILLVAWPIYSKSIRSAIYLHQADLGVLVSISTLTTYLFSVIAYIFYMLNDPFADTLFETLGLLVTLIYIGRTVQVVARRVALSAVANLHSSGPRIAHLVENDQPRDIDCCLLHYDDTVRVSEGNVVPTDGVVLTGTAAIDEAAISGEINPVTRGPGSTVLAGTTVKDGSLDFLVTRLESNNSLSAIRLTAHQDTNEYYDLADRLAGYLLWISMAAGTASWLIWMFITRYVRHESWAAAVTNGTKHFIAVMAVACPCALVLAVSLVSSTGLIVGMRHKVVFRSLSALFTANRIQAVAFDKTGTLSTGILKVAQTLHESLLATELAAELSGSNRHPISVAVKRHIDATSPIAPEPSQTLLSDIKVIPGSGVRANLHGYFVRTGNAEFTGTQDHPLVRSLLDAGQSAFLITFGERLIGGFGLVDTPREGTAALIHSLSTRYTTILSGDNPIAVNRFGTAIGINALGGLSPSGKAEQIEKLKKRYGKTAYVGDGTNDTLALAAASLSIAVGSGSSSEIAASTASIVLMDADVPTGVLTALRVASSARFHLFAGFAWCIVYFVAAILLAAGVAVDFSIPPEWAGLGEVVSILPVLVICLSMWVGSELRRRV